MSDASRRILFVLTGNDRLGDTGEPTGVFLAEAAHPYDVVTRAGYEVDFASPTGGPVPFDPRSTGERDPVSDAFYSDEAIQGRLHNTLDARELHAGDYAAVFFVGGHGTMWDFPDSEALQRLTAGIYESGGAVGAVCHGPSALVNVRLTDGTYLVAGREVAGFTTEEEQAVGLDAVVPFLLDQRLTERGAHHTKAEKPFDAHVVRDGRLVTGQNPPSSKGTAEALLEVLD